MVSGSTATVADGFVESKVALVTARDHDLPGHEGLPRARSIGDASGAVDHRAVVVAIPVHHGTRVRAGVKRRQARLTRAVDQCQATSNCRRGIRKCQHRAASIMTATKYRASAFPINAKWPSLRNGNEN
jgi:hypothetical protein